MAVFGRGGITFNLGPDAYITPIWIVWQLVLTSFALFVYLTQHDLIQFWQKLRFLIGLCRRRILIYLLEVFTRALPLPLTPLKLRPIIALMPLFEELWPALLRDLLLLYLCLWLGSWWLTCILVVEDYLPYPILLNLLLITLRLRPSIRQLLKSLLRENWRLPRTDHKLWLFLESLLWRCTISLRSS